MNQHLILDEDKELLRKSARDLFDAQAPVSVLRELRDSGDERKYSPELWQQMIELGWVGMTVPEEYDGIDFGFSGLGVVMCEAGKSLSASPFLMTLAAGATVLLRSDKKEVNKELLPKVASGACTITLAIDEGSTHQPYETSVIAQGKGDKCTLSGSKQYVIDGGFCDYFVVTARSGESKSGDAGFGLYLVDGTSSGIKRKLVETIDSRNIAHVDFKNCPATLIAEGKAALDALDFALDVTRTALAAEMLGAALESFERTVSYLKEREQFDAKIGSFQALQHRAAQLYSELELTRSVVYDAMGAIEQAWNDKSKDARNNMSIAATRAKIYANESYHKVSGESIQMHGGIGMTDEFDIGFFLKRMQVASQSFGDSNFLYSHFADLVGV